MFDIMPYWMWVVSLIVLAVVCGGVLSFNEPKRPVSRVRRVAHPGKHWIH